MSINLIISIYVAIIFFLIAFVLLTKSFIKLYKREHAVETKFVQVFEIELAEYEEQQIYKISKHSNESKKIFKEAIIETQDFEYFQPANCY